MSKRLELKKGQRWQLRTPVDGFEEIAVIAHMSGPIDELDDLRAIPGLASILDAVSVQVYVRYRPGPTVWTPAGMDGVAFWVSNAVFRAGTTDLLAKGVRLPSWWPYGRPLEPDSAAPIGRGTVSYMDMADALRSELHMARDTYDRTQSRQMTIEEHRKRHPAGRPASPPSGSIGESWDRIVKWMADQGGQFELRPGADPAAIAAFERKLGFELPDDVRESLRLHNGGGWLPPNNGELLSVDGIEEQWARYRDWQERESYGLGKDWVPSDIAGPIKKVFWNPRRIPLTDNSGDHVMLDLDPPADGHHGQILEHCHEVGPRRVLGSSWSDFLRRLVSDLEAGRYVYLPDEGCCEPLDEAEKRR